jgi:dihydroorotase
MKLLVQQALIIHPNSPFHNTRKDILIENGIVAAIENTIENLTDITTIDASNSFISSGFVDVFTDVAEPGFEYRETIETAANAALAGGFTTLFSLPNVSPVTQTKAQVAFAIEKGQKAGIQLYPLGAASKDIEGKSLADMYDMKNNGAIAFTDGKYPIQSSALLLKALQYVKAFNGIIIQLPIDTQIGKFGLMNEGIVSTQLGLPGIPALAETLLLKRDIDLLEYTNSKLHIVGISTAESVQLIKQAKAKGLQITCSVTPYHLLITDDAIATFNYNTNYKLPIPLRTEKDKIALQEALLDGTIDSITSMHLPLNWDEKNCEFEYAKAGCIGLQTCYNLLLQIFPNLPAASIVNILSINNRNIFKLPVTQFSIGSAADFTIFSNTTNSILTEENNKSKSTNSAYLNTELPGKIIATINNKTVVIN